MSNSSIKRQFLKKAAIIALLFTMSCAQSALRGFEKPSKDEHTYLVIVDDEGGGLTDSIYVDNELWPYVLGEKGRITPGKHCLSNYKADCSIEFEVKPNTIFFFDYWGP